MTLRKVQKLLYSHQVDMGGIPVRQPLPSQQVDQIDPFILIHHHKSEVQAGSRPLATGVGPHPHRGFSPVTFIYEGDVNHRDSRGNNSIVKAGGVQWMNAGMGIIHSERPSAEFAERGGKQEIIQLWINTPAKFKMDQPAYYALDKNNIPVLEENGNRIAVVAGNYKGNQGFDKSQAEVLILNIEGKAGSELNLEVPEAWNECLYNFDGAIMDAGFGLIEPLYLALYQQSGTSIQLQLREDTRILLLCGKPIQEPLVSYGPFVMNSESQIMEAMRDYQMGKMGMLIEE